MVFPKEDQKLIYNIKLSSVGPGKVTGQDASYEPSNMDLAMKLHYLRGVYYFPSQAYQGLNVMSLKEPSFWWLTDYYMTCGRFRRSDDDSGRPYVKCNDAGARFIEAQCDKTLDEWLEMKDASLEKLLVSDKVLGPELQFSPLTYLQLTKFKCGGISLGLSWSHVLGDAFSATDYMNAYGKYLAGKKKLTFDNDMAKENSYTYNKPAQTLQKYVEDPLSVKRVGPVQDHWITPTDSKMETFSFHINSKKLSDLQFEISGKDVNDLSAFEAISAVIWKCVAKIREGNEPKMVTICKRDSRKMMDRLVGNTQFITVVKAEFPVSEANVSELGKLINSAYVDERGKIEEAMEKENGVSDFIVYGANLTFLNLEDAKLYEIELQEIKPVRVSYLIDGVGDEGTVLVLPGPKNAGKDGEEGRIVTVILPENQVIVLKSELKKNGLI